MSNFIQTESQKTALRLRYARRFNFTAEMPEGAWIESADGHLEWYPFQLIKATLGANWLNAQLSAQGWMSGIWIECLN